ncbi:hypothetical protein AVEN_123105-1 [Araneus ventricosus]|uniref:Uncharacterized protein n=1 Tax=Araneus ventricosus TaxID=182803 RepID=A0A4Y2L731_ARAVE|nr:hypothetical protein AVEN_123105-1 [Araneus ventricosus]
MIDKTEYVVYHETADKIEFVVYDETADRTEYVVYYETTDKTEYVVCHEIADKTELLSPFSSSSCFPPFDCSILCSFENDRPFIIVVFKSNFVRTNVIIVVSVSIVSKIIGCDAIGKQAYDLCGSSEQSVSSTPEVPNLCYTPGHTRRTSWGTRTQSR